MITDHTRIYNELKKLASEKHLLLPIEMNSIQTNQLEKMKELNSIKFDQKYMLLMVKSHQKALNTYKIGLNNKDLAVNKFAKEKIIHLRDHLDSASSIFNKVIITHQ
jgi:predicted outer membrane protein